MVTLASRKKMALCADMWWSSGLQERFPAPDVLNPLLSNLTLSWIKSFSWAIVVNELKTLQQTDKYTHTAIYHMSKILWAEDLWSDQQTNYYHVCLLIALNVCWNEIGFCTGPPDRCKTIVFVTKEIINQQKSLGSLHCLSILVSLHKAFKLIGSYDFLQHLQLEKKGGFLGFETRMSLNECSWYTFKQAVIQL